MPSALQPNLSFSKSPIRALHIQQPEGCPFRIFNGSLGTSVFFIYIPAVICYYIRVVISVKKRVSITFDIMWVINAEGKETPAEKLVRFMTGFYENRMVLLAGDDCRVEAVIDFDSRINERGELERIITRCTGASFSRGQVELTISDNCPDVETVSLDQSEQKICEYASERLESLVGCPEFSALINEICSVAPQIIANKTYESFAYRNYLFSVNDGYGLSEYLYILSDVINRAKLFRFTAMTLYEEIKLEPARNESEKEMLDGYIESLKKYESKKLVCFDISRFLSRTDMPVFRDFLKALEDFEQNYIFVFRIPFVEDDVLAKVQADISDVLYVSSVSIAPFTMSELTQCLYSVLTKYGFSIRSDAVELFERRMNAEKSDGRFYGINTVKKIANEMIYLKQLSNIRNNTTDRVISASDVKALVTDSESNLSAMEQLEALKGMESVKTQILEIVDQIEYSIKNNTVSAPCINMRFVGNPGTGKTTVARILGRLLRERGVLRNGNFFEYSGRDLCGRYVGETAPKTAGICRDAYGSILFIDEAYSLFKGNDDSRDFGKEAITTLIAEMENHREDLVVIMAGYTKDMDTLMQANSGLRSRMPYLVQFSSFSREVLADIFMSMVADSFEYSDSLEAEVRDYFNSLSDDVINADDFGNARYVRNMYEKSWSKAVTRSKMENCDKVIITAADFRKVAMIENSAQLNKKQKIKLGF